MFPEKESAKRGTRDLGIHVHLIHVSRTVSANLARVICYLNMLTIYNDDPCIKDHFLVK